MKNAVVFLLGALFLIPAPTIVAADPPTKKIRSNEKFTATTLSKPGIEQAVWFVANAAGTFEAAPENAAQMITHYRTSDPKRAKDGIFVLSFTHSVPLTPKEIKALPPYQVKLHQSKQWRDSENKLVEELVGAANKEGIPVWINVTADLKGLYENKLLTDPALTLKKRVP